MNPTIHELVANTLMELGCAVPSAMIQTMLIQDGHFGGFKFRHDNGHAILRADGLAIDFFDAEGVLIKTVEVGAEHGAAA
jgi:hypothetical protein